MLMNSSVFCHCSGEKKTGDDFFITFITFIPSCKGVCTFKQTSRTEKLADKNGFKQSLTSADDQMFSFMLI